MQSAAPGWYPGPDGTQRYWDGQQWLAIPPPAAGAPQRKSPARMVALVAGPIVVVLLVVVGLLIKADSDRTQAAAEQAAIEQAAAEEAASAEAAAQEAAEEEAAIEAAAQAQEDEDNAERRDREAMVPQIEASIQTMAEEHVDDGFLEGPILSVTCSPVGGGSTDDLTQQTTVFDCFVANEDNGDGTFSGYSYNATMNWGTGQFTYGMGAP
ncbi:DUF2510 domain-containing protein [Occultella glacieicola]|uniref:DUF2510 domain-containing protein n=2 Tax=Occultella glacieicola TaxID=2518684 RepID=A0ABY2E567_9MICO|nr:DUF2510 domain-containing protein [Occultella glacieicola]